MDARLLVPALLGAAVLAGLPGTAAAVKVGIIPQTPAGCPLQGDHLILNLDDEDTKNKSAVSGWTGAISHYATGTRFEFCSVDASGFQSHPTEHYAVLQIDPSCPAGSTSFHRSIRTESDGNHSGNWASGPTGMNKFQFTFVNPYVTYHHAKLYFCLFPKNPLASSNPFPNFYVPYGVFAAPSSAWLDSGYAYTDDEDRNNDDFTKPDNSTATPAFTAIVYGTDNPTGGRNTYFMTAKVSNNTCHVHDTCPFSGSTWDGANCWFGKPPPGTSAFIWDNKFYYTPLAGGQCPLPGSSFDTRNCYVRPVPPKGRPFIWGNMWYVAPMCRP